MSTEFDRLARAGERDARQIARAAQDAEEQRKPEIKRKTLDAEIATRRARGIGETIRDATVICGIVSRRQSKLADQGKVSDFTIHSVPTTKTVAEFVRTGN